jgi:hypothetical protein
MVATPAGVAPNTQLKVGSITEFGFHAVCFDVARSTRNQSMSDWGSREVTRQWARLALINRLTLLEGTYTS